MSLHASVRCRCIQDGRAKPHPFPERLVLDETAAPLLTGKPTLHDHLMHDRWLDGSCEHGGYLVSKRLGNIAMIAHVRKLVASIEQNHGLQFPILKDKVIYDGVHAGDHLSGGQTLELMKEVEAALQSSDIVENMDKEFFSTIKRLCEASIETRNPIVF